MHTLGYQMLWLGVHQRVIGACPCIWDWPARQMPLVARFNAALRRDAVSVWSCCSVCRKAVWLACAHPAVAAQNCGPWGSLLQTVCLR